MCPQVLIVWITQNFPIYISIFLRFASKGGKHYSATTQTGIETIKSWSPNYEKKITLSSVLKFLIFSHHFKSDESFAFSWEAIFIIWGSWCEHSGAMPAWTLSHGVVILNNILNSWSAINQTLTSLMTQNVFMKFDWRGDHHKRRSLSVRGCCWLRQHKSWNTTKVNFWSSYISKNKLRNIFYK